MRKGNSVVLLVVMLSVAAWCGPWLLSVEAAMTGGDCADCHVMHASQAGTTSTPNGFLLTSSCLACHAGDNNAGGSSTPLVQTSNGSPKSLAGGDFRYIASLGDAYGHNTTELSNSEDRAAMATPPGWKSGFNAHGQVGDGGGWDNTKLTCAGVWGCHGLHTATGVNGSHHNNANSGADGQAAGDEGVSGKGYRFLNGIKGWEDDVYEYNVTNTPLDGAHNIYYGEARAADTVNDTQTISYSCAECHGIFHSGATTEGVGNASFASPWIRHPVDMSMPTTLGSEYAHYTTYRIDAPLGSSDVTDGQMTLTDAADRIVMCLSCHRAHASPYPSSLRWDPTQTKSGVSGTGGCFACHGHKDGDLTND